MEKEYLTLNKQPPSEHVERTVHRTHETEEESNEVLAQIDLAESALTDTKVAKDHRVSIYF